MGEVYYIWGDTESGRMQLAFSSIVEAMIMNDYYAVIRMVTGNNYAPKLGVAAPRRAANAHCLLWVQVRVSSCSIQLADHALDAICRRSS